MKLLPSFLSLGAVVFVSLVAACGGAVEPGLFDPGGGAVDPNQPAPGGGGGQCTAAPSCDPGDQNLGSARACSKSASRCYTRSLCGATIRCAGPPAPICAGYPSCKPGFHEVTGCPNDGSLCYPESMCGATILCAQDVIGCQAYPQCDSGHFEVKSPSDCWQDDAVCYSRSMCGYTIWCTGPIDPDAGTDGGSSDGGTGDADAGDAGSG